MYNFKVSDPKFLPHASCELEFSLDLGEGMIIAGENGLGKTTLLQRFSHEYPHESVMVEQKSLDYFYDRTILEVKNLLFEARGSQIDQEIFHRLYIELGLKEKENRRLSALSGGENQSLKLVCALSQNVPMYFLDEPSQFLDSFRKEVLSNFLLSLRNSKKSVLIIEHDLSWLSGGWKVLGLEINEEKIKVGKTWTI